MQQLGLINHLHHFESLLHIKTHFCDHIDHLEFPEEDL